MDTQSLNTYAKDEIVSLLNDYKSIEYRQDHIFPYVMGKYIQHEYEIQPWFKAMLANMFRERNKALGWHILIRKRVDI